MNDMNDEPAWNSNYANAIPTELAAGAVCRTFSHMSDLSLSQHRQWYTLIQGITNLMSHPNDRLTE